MAEEKSYDVACEHLAREFIEDSLVPVSKQEECVEELAALLQETIEYYLEDVHG